MMPFVRFVPCADHSDPVGAGTVSLDEKGEGERADMPAHAGADGDADDQRHFQSVSKVVEIFQSQHQVCLLITDCVPGDEVVIAEIILCLFQFDHGDGSFRCGAEKLLFGIGAPCGNARSIGPVPAFIPGWDERTWILCRERRVDHLF